MIIFMTACRSDQSGDSMTIPASAEATTITVTAGATEPLTYKVQYFRTGGYVPETEYPYVVIVQSAKELADYISTNDKDYNFGSRESTDFQQPGGLLPASDAYDDTFFSNNGLLLVVVEEPSGSIRHEFLGFGERNEIRLRRLIPSVCTDDSANWHILIELPLPSPVLLSGYYPTVEWIVGDAESTALDYRHEMRQFVQGISAYMKDRSPGFAIIPQNGENLAILDGFVFEEYMNAIDGIGREDFLYGYYEDNMATPVEDCEFMLSALKYYKQYGKRVLVIDYCSSADKVKDSYETNRENGFISFAADERNLNSIPALPQPIFNENARDVVQLSDAKNFLYIINPESYSSKNDFLDAIVNTNYDLVIVDLFFDGSPLTASDIARIKVKENGAERLVICYMSIGEAENYRYYWKDDWNSDPPDWLGQENPDWEGNYKVNYWDPKWQELIVGNDRSYAKKILDAGFDGVYLDLIDAFEYYEEQ